MNKQMLMEMWDHLRQVNGIGLRVIAALPGDRLDSHPIPQMRTPKELVVHLYGTVVRDIAQGAKSGQIKEDSGKNEKIVAAGIKSKTELLKYCRDCWNAADKAVNAMTEPKLAATVKTPWGVDFPGHVCFGIIQDEYLHHRGQLYAYLRALGGEPPMMWDFEHNASEYQPKAEAQKA